jgi:hypothetical protein
MPQNEDSKQDAKDERGLVALGKFDDQLSEANVRKLCSKAT